MKHIKTFRLFESLDLNSEWSQLLLFKRHYKILHVFL